MYHLFALSYGWTLAETDAVPMPMLYCLIDEIGKMPPQDILANAQIKAAKDKADQEAKGALATFQVERGHVRRRNDGD